MTLVIPAARRDGDWRHRVATSVAVVSAATLTAWAAGGHPALVAAGTALLALGVATLAWPELPTLAVMVLLYTNAVGIAVSHHGVPTVAGLVFPAALLVPLAHHFINRKQKFVAGPVVTWMLAFLAVQAVAALLSEDRSHSLDAVTTYLTEGVILYLLVVNTVRSLRVLRMAVWALLLAGGLLGALAFHQQATGRFDNNYGGFAQVSAAAFETGPDILDDPEEQPRLAGAIGQQNYHAQLMLMLVPLGFLLAWHQRSRLLAVAATGLTALILIGTGLTFSRGAAVGLGLVLVVATILGYLKFRQLLLLALGAALVLALFPQYGVRLTSVTELTSLITASGGEPGLEAADNSTQSRTTEMGAAARVFLDHPLFGVGPSMFRFYYDTYTDGVGLRAKGGERVAHNLYLELAADTGLLGLGSFLAAVGVTLASLARTRKRCLAQHPELAWLATGFLLAIVSYLATGLFLSPAFVRYFWLMMALAWVVCSLGAEAGREEVAPASLGQPVPA
jgi:hypothetical protein